MIKKLYPGGKPKAFNITYDDGVLQDIRFVELLNRYQLKGTFNLNSQLSEEEYEWIHPEGMVVKRISLEQAVKLYTGHEVASHTLTHPYMEGLNEDEITRQMLLDKLNLERIFAREIYGFAVPFSYYSPLIAYCALKCGFAYSRCSDERYSYSPPENYYWWAAGAYHINTRWREFTEKFFSTDTELALCQIVGHSYDLAAENMWEEMEALLKRISEDDSIVSMTNIELVDYLKAIRNAKITKKKILNNSNLDLWFEINGHVICVKANSSLYL